MVPKTETVDASLKLVQELMIPENEISTGIWNVPDSKVSKIPEPDLIYIYNQEHIGVMAIGNAIAQIYLVEQN